MQHISTLIHYLDFQTIKFFMKTLERFLMTGCPSWRQPHAWDAVSKQS